MMNDFEKIKSLFEKQGLFIGVVYDADNLDVRSTEDLEIIMKNWKPKIDVIDEKDDIVETIQKFNIANKFIELNQIQQRKFLSEIIARCTENK